MTTAVTSGSAQPRGLGAGLRPRSKVLPEHARAHNRSLVLQHLFHEGPTSRADLARATALTRVTISDLVAGLLAEGLVEELGTRPGQRVGKPAILVGLRTSGFHIVSIDLTDDAVMRGAVLTLTGDFVLRDSLEIDGRTGEELVQLLIRFCRKMIASASQPLIGIGIGSPGVIDSEGRVIEAANRNWHDLPLAARLTETLGIPVHVANDANIAALAEFTFGNADGTGLLVLTVSQGVGAGLIVDGAQVRGANDAAGEIGHVRVVADGGPCSCGRRGCLETILNIPALRKAIAPLDDAAANAHLAQVGTTLGVTLAPIVSALNLSEILLSGPSDLLDGSLLSAAFDTVRTNTMPIISSGINVRMAALNEDVVLVGAAVLVLSAQLGVS